MSFGKLKKIKGMQEKYKHIIGGRRGINPNLLTEEEKRKFFKNYTVPKSKPLTIEQLVQLNALNNGILKK